MKKTALITEVTGQDGSYLAELLLKKDYEVLLKILKTTNLEEANQILKQFGVTKESVEIWGSGKLKRKFLWSEDMTDACVFLMENQDFSSTYNSSDKELAEKIKKTIGFGGDLNFNSAKPDGTMRKVTDASKINNLGRNHTVDLDKGIQKLYDRYVSN